MEFRGLASLQLLWRFAILRASLRRLPRSLALTLESRALLEGSQTSDSSERSRPGRLKTNRKQWAITFNKLQVSSSGPAAEREREKNLKTII